MAPAIHHEIALDKVLAASLRRNDSQSPALIEIEPQGIAVEGFIGEQGGEIQVLQDRLHPDTVMTVPRPEGEAHQITQSIDQGQDLGGQAATGPANGLILRPPFAPVPCWWTRTSVPSTIAYSKSGSPTIV